MESQFSPHPMVDANHIIPVEQAPPDIVAAGKNGNLRFPKF